MNRTLLVTLSLLLLVTVPAPGADFVPPPHIDRASADGVDTWMAYLASLDLQRFDGQDFCIQGPIRLTSFEDTPAVRAALQKYRGGGELERAIAARWLDPAETLEPFALSTNPCVRQLALVRYMDVINRGFTAHGRAAMSREAADVRAALAQAWRADVESLSFGEIRTWNDYAWTWAQREGSGCTDAALLHRDRGAWRTLGFVGVSCA